MTASSRCEGCVLILIAIAGICAAAGFYVLLGWLVGGAPQ
jgi:hypothetical protein